MLTKHPEDDRLTSLETLARWHKAVWYDAEFCDDILKAEKHKREYLRVVEALRRGQTWEPDF